MHGREGYAVAEEKGVVVAIDVAITPDLTREGIARDLVRRIQTLRKDADFQLDDRIVTYLDAGQELRDIVAEWSDYVQTETLSLELIAGPVPDDAAQQGSYRLGGYAVTLGVRKA